MVIFHSYVSLPEGSQYVANDAQVAGLGCLGMDPRLGLKPPDFRMVFL
jgi:hypothetical protein